MRATLSFLRPLSPAYRHLGIAVPGFPAEVPAGRFVMLRPPWVGDPYLPRAFSIYRLSRTADGIPLVEILLKLVGKGTRLLAELSPGQPLELLGPLGNAFTPPPAGATAVLAAGGIGVPPLAAFATQIRNPKSEIRNCAVFLGGKTAEDILCLDDFTALGIEPHITTEDGSLGARGMITDLLAPFLAAPHSPLALYTCGPPGMLAAVAHLAEAHALPCQVSVEASMACGFGACMGCAIEMRSAGPDRRYALVCKDGPVFDAREILWDRESRESRAEHRAGRGCGCHES